MPRNHLKHLICTLVTLPLAGVMSVALAGDNDRAYPRLEPDQLQWLGDQIFRNECNRQPACLTAWNSGEDFPSLGIGHFIWYQAGQEEIFNESFPDLLRFMQQQGVGIPAWITANNLDSPWQNRSEFLAAQNSTRVQELRQFLLQHTALQTAFIIDRFDNALAEILATLPEAAFSQQQVVQDNFSRVAASSPPYGLYALIDYVNFKGTGTSPRESYQGEGWGLKQVLLGMDSGAQPLPGFVASARAVLAARVDNAPADRNEARWLTGWNNRLDSYLPPAP